ncbi:MAG: hypothetical protein ACREEE_15320 [Dongiaceae bacterium]
MLPMSKSLWSLLPQATSKYPHVTYVVLVGLVAIVSGIAITLSFNESWQLSKDVLKVSWIVSVMITVWLILPWAAMLGSSRVLRVIGEHVIADAALPDSPREGSGLAIRILTAAWILPFVVLPFSDVPDNLWLWMGSTVCLSLFTLFVAGMIRVWERIALNNRQQVGGMEWRSVHRIRSDGDMCACNWSGAMLSVLFVPNFENCVGLFTGGRPSYVAWEDLDTMIINLSFAFVPTAIFSVVYPLSRAFVSRRSSQVNGTG